MIIGTVGLPRSGKSTFAKKLKFIRINRDQIRLSLYGQRFFRGGEGFVSAITNTMLSVLNEENDIVLDECNLTRKKRLTHPNAYWVYFNTDAEVCKKRAIETNQEDLVDVIDNMNMSIEPPKKCLAIIDKDGNFVKSNKTMIDNKKDFDLFVK